MNLVLLEKFDRRLFNRFKHSDHPLYSLLPRYKESSLHLSNSTSVRPHINTCTEQQANTVKRTAKNNNTATKCAPDASLGWSGAPYGGLYGEAPPERGTFFQALDI